MRMLVEQDRLSTRDGHVAVGWLIVEDLFTVAARVVLPALALQQANAADMTKSVAADMGKVA
jgi:CPA2 family monovalent cation:H+ antiporter-2